MNNFNYKRLCPFKWYVLQNFPFIEADFDAITNYQLFCKVVEYLNKTIDNVNILGQLVEEFSNYFNNLDVQEEINNKLDEMVEAGTLQEIIADYLNSKAVFGFDTVEDMKQATNLINGSYAKTLGYYEINDGGAGLYKIIESDLEDNGGNIHVLNNGLRAELIVEDSVNVKQFGAKGDNLTDDTNSFLTAIDYCGNNKTLFIPKASYKITNTLTIPDSLYLECPNGVATINHFGNNDLIVIKGHKQTSSDVNIGSSTVGENKPLIKNIILKENEEISNSTAIVLQTNNDEWLARINIKDIQIIKFKVALKFANNNCYLISFERVNFWNNKTAIETPSGNIINSGERNSFTDCVFSSNNIVLDFLCEGFDFNFVNCSIDYNGCFLHDLNGSGRRTININNCHYETKVISTPQNAHGILYGHMNGSYINVTNSIIFTKITENQFNNSNVVITRKMELNFSNNRLLYWEEDFNNFYDIKNLYFFPTTSSCRTSLTNNKQGWVTMGKPLSPTKNILLDPGFSKLNNGVAVIDSSNNITDSAGNISNWKIEAGYQTNVANYKINDINNFTGTKSMQIIPTDSGQALTSIITTNMFILDNKFLKFFINFVIKNISKIEYRLNYFTTENRYISSSEWSSINISGNEDVLLKLPRIEEIVINRDIFQHAGKVSLSLRINNDNFIGFVPEIMSINIFNE